MSAVQRARMTSGCPFACERLPPGGHLGVAMRRATLLPALVVGCDSGAPVESPRPVHVTSVDTLRHGEIAPARGSGLARLRSTDPAALIRCRFGRALKQLNAGYLGEHT